VTHRHTGFLLKAGERAYQVSVAWLRSVAVLGLVASSAGLYPDQGPARSRPRRPRRLQGRRLTKPQDAPPTLDWWRGFRSRELTTLMEEAQTVNLDIAAATARFVQADAQARSRVPRCYRGLSGSGSESYSRTSGSSASGLTNGGARSSTISSSLSASYELDSGARTAMPPRPRKKPPWPTASIVMLSH